MDAVGGIATYALGYNEQDQGIGMVFLNDTQTPIHLGFPDYRRNFVLIATDGVTGYFANPGLTPTGYYFPRHLSWALTSQRAASTTSPQSPAPAPSARSSGGSVVKHRAFGAGSTIQATRRRWPTIRSSARARLGSP
jgi:hypothetical protein